LIKEFEGFHPNAYADPLHGWAVPTIGWGTIVYPDGRKVARGDTITQAQGDAYLADFVGKKVIPSLSKIPTWNQMNDNQKAAVICFAYNLGPGFYGDSNFNSITNLLRTTANWGNKAEVIRVFTLYRNPGSNVEEGLKRRRTAEANKFCTPSATSSYGVPTPPPAAKGPLAATQQAMQTPLSRCINKDEVWVFDDNGRPGTDKVNADDKVTIWATGPSSMFKIGSNRWVQGSDLKQCEGAEADDEAPASTPMMSYTTFSTVVDLRGQQEVLTPSLQRCISTSGSVVFSDNAQPTSETLNANTRVTLWAKVGSMSMYKIGLNRWVSGSSLMMC